MRYNTIETFHKNYNISEQINCWPGKMYTGDCAAFDAWLNTSLPLTAEEKAIIENIWSDDSVVKIARGGYGNDRNNRVNVGDNNGYEFYSDDTSSTSVTFSVLSQPNGRVIAWDSNGNEYAFMSLASMPGIEHETVTEEEDES
jgi:hypothetical protein